MSRRPRRRANGGLRATSGDPYAAAASHGPLGSSLRRVLGLPSVAVTLAENQRPAAKALAQAGALLWVDAEAADFDTAFDRAITRLFIDRELRRSLTEKSAEICDGLGTARVAEAFWPLLAQAATV